MTARRQFFPNPAPNTAREDDWRAQAACSTYEGPWPSPWDYDAPKDMHTEGQIICRTVCPVREQCAAEAKKTRPDCGVWAGDVLDEKGKPLPATGRCDNGHNLISARATRLDGKCRKCEENKGRDFRRARRERNEAAS